MTTADQISAFQREIEAVVHRYRLEFELPVAAAVGVLAYVQHDLIDIAQHDAQQDEEEDEDDA